MTSGTRSYRLRCSRVLRDLDGPLQAGTADVDVLAVAVLGQKSEERADVQVVIIVKVTEPPTTSTTLAQQRTPRMCACVCVSVFPSLLAGADEGVVL